MTIHLTSQNFKMKISKKITRPVKKIYLSTSGLDSNNLQSIENSAYPLATFSKALEVALTIDNIYDVEITLLNGVYHFTQELVINNYSRKVVIKAQNNRNSVLEPSVEITSKSVSGGMIYFESDNIIHNLIVSDTANNFNRRCATISKKDKNNSPFSMLPYVSMSDYEDNVYILRGADGYSNIILTSSVAVDTKNLMTGYPLMETVSGGYVYKIKDISGNEAVSEITTENIHLEWAKAVNTHKMKVEVDLTIYNAASPGQYFAAFCAWESYKFVIAGKQVINSKNYLIVERSEGGQQIIKPNGKCTLWNSTDFIQPGDFVSTKNQTTGKYDNYYYPKSGETISNIRLFRSVLQRLITVKNSSNITFKGLKLGNNNPSNFFKYHGQAEQFVKHSIIYIDSCRNVDFVENEVSGTFDYSVTINNSSDCYITDNYFNSLWGGAISVGKNSKKCNIDNNIIKNYGLQQEGVVGALLWGISKSRITYNSIVSGYYTGISLGWGWSDDVVYSSENYIANNHIHHLFKGLLTDGGGIYNLGKTKGTLIEYNLIHDIVGSSISYSAGAVYYDQGSTEILLRNNILYGTVGLSAISSHTHKIENNIFAYPISFVFGAESSIIPSLNSSISGNIILMDKGTLFTNTNEGSSAFTNNLIIDLSDTVSLPTGTIRNNNFKTSINPFTDSKNGDFGITQTKAKELETSIGYLLSNRNTNAQVNYSHFNVWWRFTPFNYGVKSTMWAYEQRDITAQEKIDLKTMYNAKYGSIGIYFTQ